jgi:hypothetical protein
VLLKQPFVHQSDRELCEVLHSHSYEYCQPDLMYVPTFRSNAFLPSSGWQLSVDSCIYYRKYRVKTDIVSPANGKLVHWRRQDEGFRYKCRPVVNTAVTFSFRK